MLSEHFFLLHGETNHLKHQLHHLSFMLTSKLNDYKYINKSYRTKDYSQALPSNNLEH